MKLIVNEIEKKFEEKEVLKGASFTFEKGKIYGLLGRNGAGKTTLFNCISHEIDFDGGSVSLEENGENRPVNFDMMGYAFSTPVLPEFLTGYEFIKFFLDIHKGKMQLLCLLISKPPIILLDEPLTSLDVVAAHEMKELLLAMKKDHIIILSTHILQLAQDLCDEIVLLHQGKLSGVDDLDCHDQGFEEHVMELLSR